MNRSSIARLPNASNPEYRSVMMNSLPQREENNEIRPLPLFESKAELKRVPFAIVALHTTWTVQEALPAVPDHYLLETTNLYIKDSSPQEIAARIYDCLKQESIAIELGGEYSNSLMGEGNCGMKIMVRLFTDQKNVIVEVQRRTGCSYKFHQLRMVIFQSAKGLKNVPRKKKPDLSIPSCIPRISDQEKTQRLERDVEMSVKLVQAPRIDAQLLGLECLEVLSEDRHCASTLNNDTCISRLLLFSSTDNPNVVMRRRALAVLVNILGALDKEEEINQKLKDESFVNELVSSMNESATRPLEACHAARCLRRVISLDSASFESLSRNSSLLTPRTNTHHLDLELETNRLQQRLRHISRAA